MIVSVASTNNRLELPETLQQQLWVFRRRVWTIKVIEALGAAACGVLLAYFAVFALDRAFDTPVWLRLALFVAAIAVCMIVPLYFRHWIWNHRKLDQLARLLCRRLPSLGDQLLGIIELVRNDLEQSRSRALCEAAIGQVAADARNHNFQEAAPPSRYRLWTAMALGGVGVVVVLGLVAPEAAMNAWQRFFTPWQPTARYTFAAVERLPDRIVVPHGESFSVVARLAPDSRWQPTQGTARMAQQPPQAAALADGSYSFELPPQVVPSSLDLRIGDARQRVAIEPVLRPELTALEATVQLPEYLGLPDPVRKDVRGGSVSLVLGSRVTLAAKASRTLSSGSIDQHAASPQSDTLTTSELAIEADRKVVFEWLDEFGLSGQQPFTLTIVGRPDEAPSINCEDLPRQKVLLNTEQLNFKIYAQDDFGVRLVGLEWQGIDAPLSPSSGTRGERILAAGGHDQSNLAMTGTFSAQSLGITPQPIQLRIFVEDYFPERGRVYSAPYLFYVLDPQQHAIWLTEQLSKWHRQSLEVRDREMQLYEVNKQLRELPADELNRVDTRRRIENQAAAERSNGRRLANLTAVGDDLVQQATRNPEFGVGHLEKWAEMLQILKDISANRMPTVADLLNDAAQAPNSVAAKPTEQAPGVGQIRNTTPGGGANPDDNKSPPKPAVPTIVDIESSQQPKDPNAAPPPPSDSKGSPSLSLPVTLLAGGGGKAEACPAGEKVEEAVRRQEDLLAEFDKIADELNRILANLEGSTLVKRLKAASRKQYEIAGKVNERISHTFGLSSFRHEDQERQFLQALASSEAGSSQEVSHIMDDMQAYFERRRYVKFKNVLEEMQQTDVIGGLRQIGEELPKETGLSIAQCEYWSDSLDRWAEELVDPVSGGT